MSPTRRSFVQATPALAKIAPETRHDAAKAIGSLGAAFCHYLAHDWSVEDCAAFVQEESTSDAVALVKAWLRDVERAL